MRLSDLEKWGLTKPEAKEQPKLETRESSLTTEQVVRELKMENTLAKEKLEKIPEETKEQLKPFFTNQFWKEGTA